MRFSRGFTLIELLVVIAIIAILSIVVVLVLNPAELLRQSRDSNRVSDLSTLNTTLGVFASQSTNSMGTSSVVYVSIPDPSATSTAGDQCQGLGLPSLPSMYTYHCVMAASFRSVNGTGWIPVNFASLSGGAPFSDLPIDPLNTSSTRNYFTYTTNGSQYEVTAPLESQKYKLGGSNDVISGDGGQLATVYEKGSKLGLEPLDYGDPTLAGFWDFEEGSSSVAYDYSGANATGSWVGSAVGTFGYYAAGKVGTYAGAFSSTTISPNFQYSETSASNMSWTMWIDLISAPGTPAIIGNRNGSNWVKFTPAAFEYNTGSIIPYAIPTGTWVFLVITKSGSNFTYYANGVSVGTASNNNPVTNMSFYLGGDPNYSTDGYPHCYLDNVRFYNRALSAGEVTAMYNGLK